MQAVDSRFLESMLGYNARRASLVILGHFVEGMADFALGPVDFSVLSLVRHNPGITSRQLCAALSILPPNVVGLVSALEQRGLLKRKPHPHDGRAVGLHLSAAGETLTKAAEAKAEALENEAAANLNASDRKTLMRLLQKVYL